MVAKVGSTVRLPCWINATTVHWDNYGRANPTVYDGSRVIGPLRARYSVETNGDQQHSLVISNITVTDAGNYSCYNHSNSPEDVLLLLVLTSKF